MPKVILISQNPLPNPKIGSWTTMYKNYFESKKNSIDTIICKAPKNRFKNVEYGIVPNGISNKIKRKITKNTYQNYLETLFKCVNDDEKYIIQIVDNFGFAKALKHYLETVPTKRKHVYIQFFYHGFPPYFGNFESRWFFEFIDEMVLLTDASYQVHKNSYTILPCMFSILPNGIDTTKFRKPSVEEKKALKQKFNVEEKKVFLWCSQDRPKKGLDFILNVWKRVTKNNKAVELWVVGAERSTSIPNVRFFGKIPNDKLPEYYQTSDCYLFPVLNQEGFGMSLIEALHCGNYCIASALGGVPEVLQHGKYGVLIENPHFINEWIIAIHNYLKEGNTFNVDVKELYTKENWVDSMNRIILNAKLLIE